VLARDAAGVQALEFRFDRPLTDPHYRFFVASRTATAQPWTPEAQACQPVGGSPPKFARAMMCSAQLGVDNFAAVLDRMP
jgi:hypothetical protein